MEYFCSSALEISLAESVMIRILPMVLPFFAQILLDFFAVRIALLIQALQ